MMHAAILSNDVQALKACLAGGVTVVNEPDGEGYTPLYYACMKNSTEVRTVATLLERGATVDAKGRDGETALYIAIFHRRLDLADVLLGAGANVNVSNGSMQETALHLAARTSFSTELRWLMAHGATCDVVNARRETPLFVAARAGRHESVYVLLQAGADTTVVSVDGKDALFIASEKGHKAVVVLLKAARGGDLRRAKAEADRILSMQPQPLPSSEDVVRRASADVAYAQHVHLGAANVHQARSMPDAPLKVLDIVVPQPKHPAVDPFTGKASGPCRTLQEVGYETAPAVPRELQDRPPAALPRIGGTSMVVGTGTNGEGKVPVRVDDILLDDTIDYSQVAQHL